MAIINQIASNNGNHETLRFMLIGSRETVTQLIHILHHINFADASDWSPLKPTKNASEFITILNG